MSQVPCLQAGNKVLTQSLPILLYLEKLKPQPALLPKKPFERARALAFCEIINSGIQPLQNLAVLQYIEKEGSLDKAAWAAHWIRQGLSACEAFLRQERFEGDFCFGKSPGMADLFLIPQLYNAERFGLKAKDFPILEKAGQACLQIPAFQKAHPDNQPDAPFS